jgi:hypothetical protein
MYLNNTFVHHVHFWLKNKADKAKLIEGLETLKPIIHIRDMHMFNTLEEEEAYQHDPTHVIFAEQYAKPLCARVLVLDNVNI